MHNWQTTGSIQTALFSFTIFFRLLNINYVQKVRIDVSKATWLQIVSRQLFFSFFKLVSSFLNVWLKHYYANEIILQVKNKTSWWRCQQESEQWFRGVTCSKRVCNRSKMIRNAFCMPYSLVVIENKKYHVSFRVPDTSRKSRSGHDVTVVRGRLLQNGGEVECKFSLNQSTILQTCPKKEKRKSKCILGDRVEKLEERKKKRIPNILHMLHNITQWSQNEMTRFTIFMAFCLFFYTIYNNFISFFQYKGGKKCLCTISPYYFKPSKYRVIYLIVNKFVYF